MARALPLVLVSLTNANILIAKKELICLDEKETTANAKYIKVILLPSLLSLPRFSFSSFARHKMKQM